MLKAPISIYINWAAYDELSDVVELTEALAMQQFEEMQRLRAAGVRIDCYLMDAFWYQPDGAYRTWRKPHWPQGPDRWLDACLAAGVKPGIWTGGNTLKKLEAAPRWRDSLADGGHSVCLFHGGFLPDYLEALASLYARGIRVFKFDFLNLDAAPDSLRRVLLPSEIRARNLAAFRKGLSDLRGQCPDIIMLGYNGLEEAATQTQTDLPFRHTVDPKWLEVFDAVYCGDPRPSDVPAMNFWRSKDIYSDHMVSVYQRNGFPLSRIDNSGFMIGKTGTCYYRGRAAWRGMLILSLARGGWANTYYGNLELLDQADAAWFAKVQAMFFHLQAKGRLATFGGIPGEARPYGYVAEEAAGSLVTVVNPAQAVETVSIPGTGEARLLFHDAGYPPSLRDGHLTLGPEQMAVVGLGRYNDPAFDLGLEPEVKIPSSITPWPGTFQATAAKTMAATVKPPEQGCLRIVVHQKGRDGLAKRSSGGAPPHGVTLGRILTIEASQGGRPVEVAVAYDKAIWSGLSWAVGEIRAEGLVRGEPLHLLCRTSEPAEVSLTAALYQTI